MYRMLSSLHPSSNQHAIHINIMQSSTRACSQCFGDALPPKETGFLSFSATYHTPPNPMAQQIA